MMTPHLRLRTDLERSAERAKSEGVSCAYINDCMIDVGKKVIRTHVGDPEQQVFDFPSPHVGDPKVLEFPLPPKKRT
jgi:hypothetical protein